MGEKIRDIRPIHLVGDELMVELNEGYTSSQGRVIHIQNPKFRYLLKEEDFYRAASDIMRADVELHYIKEHIPHPDIRIPENKEAGNLEEFSFLPVLKESDIIYRILELRKSVATILIRPEDFKSFHKLTRKMGLKQLEHPFGKRHGYKFLYQMKPFEMYEYKGRYYEIMYQLPCKSLTPKMWMPLDKCVQHALWQTCKTIDGYCYTADEELWIYLVTRCIFMKMQFEEKDRAMLDQLRPVLQNESLKQKLSLIVFGFAGQLITMAGQGDYDHIITAYYTYTDY